jgi:hypothetical protein
MRMRHIAVRGLHRYTTFFPHFLINGKIFEKVTERKMCVFILYTIFIRNISYSKKKCARYNKKRLASFMQSTHHCC